MSNINSIPPAVFQVKAKIVFDEPLAFVKTSPDLPEEPVFRSFECKSIIARTEAEARERYIAEHRPAGAASVKILTVQRRFRHDIDLVRQAAL
jgi:hypothetical protein